MNLPESFNAPRVGKRQVDKDDVELLLGESLEPHGQPVGHDRDEAGDPRPPEGFAHKARIPRVVLDEQNFYWGSVHGRPPSEDGFRVTGAKFPMDGAASRAWSMSTDSWRKLLA